MAKFEICSDQWLGFDHSNDDMFIQGVGYVELSNEEVGKLVALMTEKESADVGVLELRQTYPDIFQKLDAAYQAVAREAELDEWLQEGFHNEECHNYEDDEMIEFLKSKNAWHFTYDEKEYLDENGELNQEWIEDAESDYLHNEAIEEYLYTLDDYARRDFLMNVMGIEVDLDFIDYEVKIPEEIVQMAFPEK